MLLADGRLQTLPGDLVLGALSCHKSHSLGHRAAPGDSETMIWLSRGNNRLGVGTSERRQAAPRPTTTWTGHYTTLHL